MSVLFLWNPYKLISNSWPSSGVKFSPNSSTITANHLCVATSCRRPPSPVLSAPGGKKNFQITHLIPPCLIFLMLVNFLTREVVNKLFLHHCCFLHVLSWWPISGAAHRRSSFPVRFSNKYLSTNQNGQVLATSSWRSLHKCVLAYDNLFFNTPCWAYLSPSITQQHCQSKSRHRSTNP